MQAFLCIALLTHYAHSMIDFSMGVSRTKAYFGELIYVDINGDTWEKLPSVEVYLYSNSHLRFTAQVQSQTCVQASCTSNEFDIDSWQLPLVSRLVFDREVIENARELRIVPHGDSNHSWPRGTSHHTRVQLQRLRTSNPKQREWLIARVRYANHSSVADVSTQTMARKYFQLIPIKLALSVYPITYFYANSVANLSIALEGDPVAFPVRIEIRLPYKNVTVEQCGSVTLDGIAADCRRWTEKQQIINIIGTPTVISDTAPVQFIIPMPYKNYTDLIEFHVERQHIAALQCTSTCRLKLVLPIQSRAEHVAPGDQLLFAADVFYGSNFSLVEKAAGQRVAITGPHLQARLSVTPKNNVQAGDTLIWNLVMEHSPRSTEALRLVSVTPVGGDRSQQVLSAECDGVTCSTATTPFAGHLLNAGDKATMRISARAAPNLLLNNAVTLALRIAYAPVEPIAQVCLPESCLNGGTCDRDIVSSKCRCSSDFAGRVCEQRVCSTIGWLSPAKSVYCYWRALTTLSYKDAQSLCEKQNAHLPVFKALDELDNFFRHLRSQLLPPDAKVWLGYTRSTSSNQWRSVGEGATDTLCAAVNIAMSKQTDWLVVPCSDSAHVFCQDTPLIGSGEYFELHVEESAYTQRVQVTAIDMGIDQYGVRYHQPLVISVDFRMPRGSLTNAALRASFSLSNGSSVVPVDFIFSRVRTDERAKLQQAELVYVDDLPPAIVRISKGPGPVRYRVKRLTSSRAVVRAVHDEHAQFTRQLGNITAAESSNIQVESTFVATPTPQDTERGALLRIQLELVLGEQEYLLTTRETRFVRPHCMLTKHIVRQVDEAKATPVLGAQDEVRYGTSAVMLRITHLPHSTAPAMALAVVDDIADMTVEWSNAESLTRLGNTVRVTKAMLSVHEDRSYRYRISASSSMPLGVVYYRNATLTYNTISERERQFPDYQGMTYTVTSSVCLVRGANDNRTEEVDDYTAATTGALGIFLLAAAVLLVLLLCLATRCYRKDKRSQTPQELRDAREREVHDTTTLALLSTRSANERRHAIARQAARDYAKEEHQLYEHYDDVIIRLAAAALEEELSGGARDWRRVAKRTLKQFAKEEAANAKKVEAATRKAHKKIIIRLREKHEQELARLDKTLGPNSSRSQLRKAMERQHAAELDQTIQRLSLNKSLRSQEQAGESHERRLSRLAHCHRDYVEMAVAKGKLSSERAAALHEQYTELCALAAKWIAQERAHAKAILDHRMQLLQLLAEHQTALDTARATFVQMLLEKQQVHLSKLLNTGAISQQQHDALLQEITTAFNRIRSRADADRQKAINALERRVLKEQRSKLKPIEARKAKQLKRIDAQLSKCTSYAVARDFMEQRLHAIAQARQEAAAVLADTDRECARQLEIIDNELEKSATEKLQSAIDAAYLKAGLTSGDHPSDYLHGDIEQLRAKQSESLQALSAKLNDQLALLPPIQQHVKSHPDFEDASTVEVLERLLDDRAPTPLPESENSECEKDAESFAVVDSAELSRVHATLVERMQQQMHAEKLRQLNAVDRRWLERKFGVDWSNLDGSTDSNALIHSANTTKLNAIREEMHRRARMLDEMADDTLEDRDTKERRMLRKRALALRVQEERIGAHLAKLALERARQEESLARQEQALHELNACMIEQLNENGIYNNTKAHEVLAAHGVSVTNIDEQLDAQRQRQEVLLRQRLQERAKRRANELHKRHAEQLTQHRQRPHSSQVSARIDEMNLLVEQAREEAKIKERLDDDVYRALERERRNYDALKQRALKDQEISLLRTLVEAGGFRRHEIFDVLRHIMPERSDKQLRQLVDAVVDDEKPRRTPSSRVGDSGEATSELLIRRYDERQQKDTTRKSNTPFIGPYRSTVTKLPPIHQRRRSKQHSSQANSSITESTQGIKLAESKARRSSTNHK